MLFLFELALFVLIMTTVALAEFVGRGVALGVWLTATVVSLVGYVAARRSVGRNQPQRAPGPPRSEEPDAGGSHSSREGQGVVPPPAIEEGSGERFAPEPLDERWARTLLYNWRRTNALLLFGVLVAGGWYWLGS